ncbi:MAG: YgaP family membrane protein [Gemmobacter sp.]|jgi:nitric oxide reductase large subunit
MFKQNVGGIDRIIRIVVGLALIAGYFLNPDASLRWLYLVGIIPLATGVLGTCGLYSLIGISTCPVKRG